MSMTKPTFGVANIQGLADLVQDQETALKILFDKTGADAKTYLIALCDEMDLELATKAEIIGITLGLVPDGSITIPKLSFDPATQTELNDAVALLIPLTQKGAVNGVAELGTDGRIKEAQGDGAWTKIAEQTLSGTVAQVDFASIAAGYKNFRIMFDAIKSTTASADLQLLFNDDTGANYRTQRIESVSTSTSAVNAVAQTSLAITKGLPDSTKTFSYGVIDISNFDPTKAKRVMGEWYVEEGTAASNQYRYAMGGIWANTAAEINKISLKASAGLIGIGSRFALWGCK
jgi:hypothetical protein